jgi:ribosomal protein L7/L12
MYGNIEDLPVEAQEKIRKAIRAGRKLDAVKVYYTQTKHSLLESKKIIEDEMDRLKNIYREGWEQLGETAGPDEMDQILDCIFASKKLDAVKIYKESTGLSLMESKKFIEGVINRLNEDCPEQYQGGKGYQSGCAVLLVLIAAVCLARAFGI